MCTSHRLQTPGPIFFSVPCINFKPPMILSRKLHFRMAQKCCTDYEFLLQDFFHNEGPKIVHLKRQQLLFFWKKTDKSVAACSFQNNCYGWFNCVTAYVQHNCVRKHLPGPKSQPRVRKVFYSQCFNFSSVPRVILI